MQWGDRGDVPVPGDFDGDGRRYRGLSPSTGQWFVPGHSRVRFGSAGGYVPVLGTTMATARRYRDLPAVHGRVGHPESVVHFGGEGAGRCRVTTTATARRISRSIRASTASRSGGTNSRPVRRPWRYPRAWRYAGDVTMEVAVYRPSTGQWFVKDQFRRLQFGETGIFRAADGRGCRWRLQATTMATARPTSPSIGRPLTSGSCGISSRSVR